MTDLLDHREQIQRHAVRHGLSPLLIAAIVQVESGGDPFAWNPEPRYRWVWDVRRNTPFRGLTPGESASSTPPGDFFTLAGDRDQEWWGQRASWGLMQLMGAVAREHGFRGPYLTQLVDVDINLDLGCRHLAKLIRRADGNEDLATGMYNAGAGGADSLAGRVYREKVLKVLTRERE